MCDPVHWFSVLRDLTYAGYSIRRTARLLGVSRSRLNRIYSAGATPRFDTGEKLLALWSAVMKKEVKDAPRKSKYDWKA